MPTKPPARFALAALALLWLAPAVLLIRANSLWTPLALVGLVCTFAAAGPRRPGPAPQPETGETGALITPPPDLPPLRPILRRTAAGAFLNLMLLGQGTGRPIAAGVFAAAATGLLLAGFPRARREAFVSRHAIASVRLAALLILIGLIRWGVHRLAPAWGEPDAVAAASTPATRPRQREAFRGVVLFAVKPKEDLAPPPPAVDPLRAAAARDRAREPLVIPFSGAYWLFRRPDLRPPPGALVRYGEPDRLFFRADDGIPLRMEAHQHLGRYLPSTCCRSLEVEVTSTERFPAGVSAEVLLADTATQATQSLGMQRVPAPALRFDGASPDPVESRLVYPMVPGGRLLRFDRISVRFVLGYSRGTHSARVAIRRFTLRP
ncbi:MAG: hypothetical protein IT162_14720 [Bryobacterales bacterium]|nr:hypothetical protein [Bryobacterales bacterium]